MRMVQPYRLRDHKYGRKAGMRCIHMLNKHGKKQKNNKHRENTIPTHCRNHPTRTIEHRNQRRMQSKELVREPLTLRIHHDPGKTLGSPPSGSSKDGLLIPAETPVYLRIIRIKGSRAGQGNSFTRVNAWVPSPKQPFSSLW